MTKKRAWQRWDRVFKEFGLAYSGELIRWLKLADDFSILGSNSPARRTQERRPDLLIDFREGDQERRVVVECDSSPLSPEDLIRRAALTQALFSTDGFEPEQVVLNLKGGKDVEEIIEQSVSIRRINVACMDAPKDIEKVSLAVLPFVGLMRNTSLDLVEGAARRSLAEPGPLGVLLTSTIFDFAELGQGLEFTMAVQQRLRAGSIFLETMRADFETMRADFEAAQSVALEKALEKAREEAREEAREAVIEQLRQMLRQQIALKFPKHKLSTIDRRLRPLPVDVLKALGLRLFTELSWTEFWKSVKS